MKKLAVVLAAVMVMALGAPAFAHLDMSGKLETQIELNRPVGGDWVLEGKTGIELETSLGAGGGNGVRAVVQLKGIELKQSFNDDDEPTEDFGTPTSAYDNVATSLQLDKVWLEADGAYWNGGPELLTRVGDVRVRWNDYVAHMPTRRGVTVEGIEMGPVNARAFYTWKEAGGLQANATIEGIDISGTVVRHLDGNEFAVGAASEVVPGIALDGIVAFDKDTNSIYRVNAEVNTVPNMTFMAGYRGYNDFEPAFGNIDNTDADDDAYDRHTGFNIGMETIQSGITLKAEYDDPTSETKLSAQRVFPVAGFDINGEYEGKLTPGVAVHTVKADTTLNMIPQLQDLKVMGKVVVETDEDLAWAAGAEYDAPNGVNIGAEYHSVDGVSLAAGLKASF